MSATTNRIVRQWVSAPGGSCDLRIGNEVIASMGSIIKSGVGKPRLCALVTCADTSDDVVEQVRRQLTDTGFKVAPIDLSGLASLRSMEGVATLSAALGAAHITSDDLVCAIGRTDILSLASFVCSLWCAGTQLVHVPCDLNACIEASTSPRGIAVGGADEMLASRLGAKYELCDLDIMDVDPQSDTALYARALMATSAMCDAEQAVQRLWDRAELLVEGDLETLKEQIADTAKSRGRIASSTSVATRQTLSFGRTFLNAVSSLVGDTVPRGLLLAEAVRFQARIAATSDKISVDDVLTLDELLDLLGLDVVTCDVDPDVLVEALRAERFLRSNRFLLNLPHGIGRVRAVAVEDEVLREHAEAWCASRATA